MIIPQPLTILNLEPLKTLCQNYITELAEDGDVDEDFPNYIFESAMETVYGKDIWDFINAKIK